MPAAATKAELIAICEKEYAKLTEMIAAVPPDRALQPDGDGVSIKDVIAHRAHWVDLFLGWYSDGQAGEEVHFPAKGYRWSDLKVYNAELRVRQAGMRWDAAQVALFGAHERLMWFLAKMSQDALYGGPMAGARNDWPTGRWAEAAGPSHYRSASKYLRARLRGFSV